MKVPREFESHTFRQFSLQAARINLGDGAAALAHDAAHFDHERLQCLRRRLLRGMGLCESMNADRIVILRDSCCDRDKVARADTLDPPPKPHVSHSLIPEL